jgi:hypothetical protein
MSTEESPVKKQKTKFIPRPGLTIQETTPVLETPIKRVVSVSTRPIVNHDKKRELIENIKNLRGEIVNSENVNSENIKNYIDKSFSFFQGTKIGYRNDEDEDLAQEIKNTIAFLESKNLLDTDNLEPKTLNRYNAIKTGSRRNTFGGSKFKKSYKRTTKKSNKSKRKRSIKKNKLIGGGSGFSSFSNPNGYEPKKYVIEFGKEYNENEDEDITKLYMISENIHEDKEPQLILHDGKYYGDIKDNERNGEGVMKYTGEDEYIGNWENDLRNGMGIMKWGYTNDNSNQGKPNPIIYVGEFEDDASNGHGKLKYDNGFTYIGKWKDGMRNGYGLVYNNKKHFIGNWKNNIFLNGTIYTRTPGFMDNPNNYYIVAEKFKNGEIKEAILETNMVYDKKTMEYYL